MGADYPVHASVGTQRTAQNRYALACASAAIVAQGRKALSYDHTETIAQQVQERCEVSDSKKPEPVKIRALI
ncbi:MAG: hypothetical protein COW02_15815 [Comamonadaceae bacterium CG12_big_fil_rev_8_21_14_0_65_59_15]|nr:MAG: hypothetical protein COW02_15815 [Comamonadaceae bacterium CG12_big_fil_rev_8_21_14_0_65_59_15]